MANPSETGAPGPADRFPEPLKRPEALSRARPFRHPPKPPPRTRRDAAATARDRAAAMGGRIADTADRTQKPMTGAGPQEGTAGRS
jgi:hypothetical protein